GFTQVTAVNSTDWSYSRVISRQLSSSSATGVHNFTVSPTATRGIGVTVNIEAFDPDTDPVGVSVAGTFGATVNAPVPAGTLNGDILISHVTSNRNTSLTPPSGWDLVRATDMGGNTWVWTYTRIASSEPASYTWGFVPDHWNYVTTHTWRGFYGVTDSAVSFSPDSTETSQTFPQLQALTNDVLLAFGYNWSNTTQSFSPAGLTERTQQARSAISGSQRITSDGPTTAYTVTAAVAGKMAATSILLSKDEPPNQHLDTEADPLELDLSVTPATANANATTSATDFELEIDFGDPALSAEVFTASNTLAFVLGFTPSTTSGQYETGADPLETELGLSEAVAGAQFDTEADEIGLEAGFEEALAGNQQVTEASSLPLETGYSPATASAGGFIAADDPILLELGLSEAVTDSQYGTQGSSLSLTVDFGAALAQGHLSVGADSLITDLEFGEPRFQIRIEDLVTVSITNTRIDVPVLVTSIPILSVSTAIDTPETRTVLDGIDTHTDLPPASAPPTVIPETGTVTSVPSMNIPPTQVPSTATTTQLPSTVVVVELDEELL